MKKSISLPICLLVVAFAASAQSPPSWKTYVMKEAELRFTVPMFPSTRVKKEKRERPQPDRKRHVFDSSAEGVDYQVSVVENPEPRQSLDAFINERKNSNWDPASERAVTVDGFAGKAFVYRNGKGMAQFFATETYLFEFLAQGAAVDDARLKKFFSSIMLKKPAGAAAENSTDSEKVYKATEVDTRLEIKSQPEITYSSDAAGERIIGTVILRCIFTSKGTVTDIRVIQGLPNGLTEKAIEAAKKIKFIPATKNGVPVSMWMQLEYNFDMSR